jgi:hypothetical protein
MPINKSNSSPSIPPAAGWLWDLLPVWVLALALSGALVIAGQQWPQPPTPDGFRVALLVLGLPLLMGFVLVGSWLFNAAAGHPDRGESGD